MIFVGFKACCINCTARITDIDEGKVLTNGRSPIVETTIRCSSEDKCEAYNNSSWLYLKEED